MRRRRAFMWTEEEDQKLQQGALDTGPESSRYKFWEAVRLAVMPYRTLSSIQQRAIKLKLIAKLHGKHTECLNCGVVGIHNRKRALCRRCYQKLRGLAW